MLVNLEMIKRSAFRCEIRYNIHELLYQTLVVIILPRICNKKTKAFVQRNLLR